MFFPHQFALHCRHGGGKPRIVDFDHAEIGKQQHAGVEIIGAKRRGKGAALLIPGALDDGLRLAVIVEKIKPGWIVRRRAKFVGTRIVVLYDGR